MSTTHEQNVSRDIASLLHPYTNLDAHAKSGPMVVAKGSGAYVEDDRGRRYLEAMSGLWSTSLGFSEARLVEAAHRQMKQLPYYQIFGGRSTEPAIELADRLMKLTKQWNFDKALFANSGSEANDQAVKLIWYYFNALGKPQKKKLIGRVRGYHGVTVMAGSLTGIPTNHADFDLPVDRVLRADCPSYYHYGQPGESEAAFVDRLAADLEALIAKEGADTIAAFFAEPVQGAGGVIIPAKGYWAKIGPILKKHGILLVADEVICGFGRTGNMFGSQTFDMQPDLMTVAKAMSSSYLPISATLVSKAVYDGVAAGSRKHGAFAHGVTYAGHPVCSAVANETLKIYEERDIVGHVRKLAPHFLERLRALASHPLVGETRGIGLIAGVELVQDKAKKTGFDPSSGIGAFIQNAALEQGLIIRSIRDTVAICPPLIIDDSQIDELFDKFKPALDATLVQARKQGLVA